MNKLIRNVFIFCSVFSVSAMAEESVETESSTISTTLQFEQAGKLNEKLLCLEMEKEWLNRGLPDNKVSICLSPECSNSIQTDYVLEINIAEISSGKLSQSLSITLEQSDPRKAHIHEQKILPVACTLRESKSGHIITAKKWNSPVPAGIEKYDQADSQHLARLLTDACEETIFDNEVQYTGIKIEDDSNREYSTSHPDVTMEKRLITSEPVLVKEQTENEETITRPEHDKTLNKAVEEKPTDEKQRTQYIIKNPASEVIIEFGQHR